MVLILCELQTWRCTLEFDKMSSSPSNYIHTQLQRLFIKIWKFNQTLRDAKVIMLSHCLISCYPNLTEWQACSNPTILFTYSKLCTVRRSSSDEKLNTTNLNRNKIPPSRWHSTTSRHILKFQIRLSLISALEQQNTFLSDTLGMCLHVSVSHLLAVNNAEKWYWICFLFMWKARNSLPCCSSRFCASSG